FWIDSTRLAIATERKQLQIDQLGLRLQVETVVTLTEEAYYNLISAFEGVRVAEAAVELSGRLVSENKRRVEVGTMAPLDEKQSESQHASDLASLLKAQETLTGAQNTLKRLITDRFKEWH